MCPTLDREISRTSDGDVLTIQRDLALPGLQHDFVFGQDVDAVGGAGDGDALVGDSTVAAAASDNGPMILLRHCEEDSAW